MLGNPYTPGAGCIPPYLAGREKEMRSAEVALDHLSRGYPQRSILYHGLRGVGKTALLNSLELSAEHMNIKYTHIEATDDNLLFGRILSSFHRMLRQMSLSEAAKVIVEKCQSLIASFSLTYDIKECKFTLDIDPQDNISSGIVEDDLTEIFVNVGKVARNSNCAICLFIDELQLMSKEQARALIMALHRCNQLRLPVMIVGAGLPKIVAATNEACSYAERMFEYIKLDKLSEEEADAAITEPADSLNVKYETEAVEHIVAKTKGYPYFLQEFCSVVWQNVKECSIITLEMVKEQELNFYHKLDEGFFSARLSRTSAMEKRFMLAMADIGGENCLIGDIAMKLERETTQISPIRATLIDKGLVYPPERGKVAFTVPLFSDYLRRKEEDILSNLG